MNKKTKICLYCKNTKTEDLFSKEHILPKSIGGNISKGKPLITSDVCKRCNNLCGLYVDSPFAKSFFINNYRSQNAAKFIKFGQKSILPLTYMGVKKDVKFEGKICETYLGATGDRIYHFHDPYPDEPYSPHVVGVPTHLWDKVDKGFVFFFLCTNNSVWVNIVLHSIMDAFNETPIYCGNGEFICEEDILPKLPDSLKKLHEQLSLGVNKKHEVLMTTDIDNGSRFLSKLALGLGHIHLNQEFLSSENADLLRKIMQSHKYEERSKIKVVGSLHIDPEQNKILSDIVKFDGAHTILIQNAGDNLMLYICFYGTLISSIKISDNKSHWEGKINTGICYIIYPERQQCIGSLLMEEIIAYKYDNYQIPELSQIEKEIAEMKPLPPFKLNS